MTRAVIIDAGGPGVADTAPQAFDKTKANFALCDADTATIATISAKQLNDETAITNLQASVTGLAGGASSKISGLAQATALTGTELVPVVQGGVNVKTTVGTLIAGRTLLASTYTGIDPTGAVDSVAAIKSAFASVAGTTTVLIIDCPIRLTIGYNINATIFVPSGTNLYFVPGAGKFIIDNNLIPAFCWVNATNCTWVNDTYQYVGATALNYAAAPYNGTVVANFSTGPLQTYMQTKFGNTFSGTGPILGGNGVGAIHLILGACANLNFYNSDAYVAAGANAATFIYNFAQSQYQWNTGLAVTGASVFSTSTVSVPTDINWYNPQLDGYYFGWTGRTGMNIYNVTAKRYSVLQDVSGGTLGGTSLWVGPAHLFYMDNTVTGFITNSTTIRGGVDYGYYVGGAIRPSTGAWGQMYCIKLTMGPNVTLENFRSYRPDGMFQFLGTVTDCTNSTVNDLAGTFDSSIVTTDSSVLNGGTFSVSSAGVRNFKGSNISITDLNPSPIQFPFSLPSPQATNNFELKGLSIYLNDWGSVNSPTFVNAAGDSFSIEMNIYFNSFSSLTTNLGFFVMQGSSTTTNSKYQIKVFGFRTWQVQWTAALVAGATSATIATVNAGTTNAAVTWPGPTGQYPVKYSDGEIRWVTFTNGASTATWANQLTGAPTVGPNQVGGIVSSNYSSNKPRWLAYQGGNGFGNSAIVEDVSNGYIGTLINGKLVEQRTQLFSCTPIGATYATPLGLLATESVIDATAYVASPALDTANGLTSFQIGYSGAAAAFLTGCPIGLQTTQSVPIAAPISLGGSARTVLLTAVGGTGFGTAVGTQVPNLMVSVTSAQVSGCR